MHVITRTTGIVILLYILIFLYSNQTFGFICMATILGGTMNYQIVKGTNINTTCGLNGSLLDHINKEFCGTVPE